MVKNLVIVESPAKAKTIEGFLGKDYVVKSSYGHVRDLNKSNLSLDMKAGFQPLYEIPEDTAADVMKLAKKMAKKMTDKLGADGFNLVQNNNEIAGQTVFHFHMHLIPRYENDRQRIAWIPTSPSSEELTAIKETLTT